MYPVDKLWPTCHIKFKLWRTSVFYSEEHNCNAYVASSEPDVELFMYVLDIKKKRYQTKSANLEILRLEGFLYGNTFKYELTKPPLDPAGTWFDHCWTAIKSKEWIYVKCLVLELDKVECAGIEVYNMPEDKEQHPLGPIVIDELLQLVDDFEAYRGRFFKIGNDCDAKYGDGGHGDIAYPLYFTQKLKVSSKGRAKLVEDLNRLAASTMDVHADCPVQDIIDPELSPVFYEHKIQCIEGGGEVWQHWVENRLAHVRYERLWSELHGGLLQKHNFTNLRREINQGCLHLNNFVHDKKYTNEQKLIVAKSIFEKDDIVERYKYYWKPCEVKVKQNDKKKLYVEFQTEIPRLAVIEENRSLYRGIATIFNALLPGFEKLGILPKNVETENGISLEVIVKAQKYVLPPHSTYTGKWHVEGVTEKIIGVATYYAFQDEGLQGGNLLFRTLGAPSPDYFNEEVLQQEVHIQEGTAVIFRNVLPHRFQTIINNTERTLERLFVNYFIVDPAHRLLDGKTEQECSLEERKAHRQMIRSILQSDKKGWGYIFHGNVGSLEYVRGHQAGDYSHQLKDDIAEELNSFK